VAFGAVIWPVRQRRWLTPEQLRRLRKGGTADCPKPKPTAPLFITDLLPCIDLRPFIKRLRG